MSAELIEGESLKGMDQESIIENLNQIHDRMAHKLESQRNRKMNWLKCKQYKLATYHGPCESSTFRIEGTVSTDGQDIKCKQCANKFTEKSSPEIHIKEKHKNVPKYELSSDDYSDSDEDEKPEKKIQVKSKKEDSSDTDDSDEDNEEVKPKVKSEKKDDSSSDDEDLSDDEEEMTEVKICESNDVKNQESHITLKTTLLQIRSKSSARLENLISWVGMTRRKCKQSSLLAFWPCHMNLERAGST